MTKLVRKLKQMAKKRSHRKQVQKRKVERIQREMEAEETRKEQRLESGVDRELARLNGEFVSDTDSEDDVDTAVRKNVRVIGNLVVEAPSKKNKKQLSRKQQRRKAKNTERGEAVAAQMETKWVRKKRRVKVRAQIRNEDLH